MVDPMDNDKTLDLDARTLDELDRKLFCESDLQEIDLPSELQGPHASRRCDSSRRELLNNSFPVEE